ncbi:MAG: hypothetical protein ACLRJV_15935 [Eubacteriales bacterium]
MGNGLLSDELWKPGGELQSSGRRHTMRMASEPAQGGCASHQGMADMMALDGGKYGKGILDSCRIKFIMQMEDQEAAGAEHLNLTEEEI